MDHEFLKPFLVDRQKYELFQEYLEQLIANQHTNMESLTDPIQIHRAQGAIGAYRKLHRLRDDILRST